MRSPKELALDKRIIEVIGDIEPDGAAIAVAKILLADDEIQALQEYANTVSIKRMGFNDHGPVHMRTVALNGIIMLSLLRNAGIHTSLQKEENGTFDDSLAAVFLASFLHDVGMSIGRHEHELHSTYLSLPMIDRILSEVFPSHMDKRIRIRSIALEGIAGHMGSRPINSLEAGLVQVADGCDMQKGRARIPMVLTSGPRMGDIHQLSANSIEKVCIQEGKEKPIRIEVDMSGEVGLFQIEEVLLAKISASPVKPYIELFANVDNKDHRQYL